MPKKSNATKSTKDVQIPEWIKRMREQPPTVIYKGKGFTKQT